MGSKSVYFIENPPNDFGDAWKIASFTFFPNVTKLLTTGSISSISSSEAKRTDIRRLKKSSIKVEVQKYYKRSMGD